jgi:hypothetical protein
VPVGQVVTPRPPQLPVSLVRSTSGRRHVDGGVVQSRWPGYQWAGLAPITPLVEPHVQALVAPGEERRHVRGAVVAPRPQALITAAAQRVTFDAATQSASGLTFLHTCSGSNRFLTVGIGINGTTTSVASMTYAGVAMTLISRAVGTAFATELWGLVNPATGANNVAITMSGAGGTQAGAVSFNNVDQTTPLGTNGTNFGTGTSATSAPLTVPTGGMLVDAAVMGNAGTPQSPTIAAWNDGGGDSQGYVGVDGTQNTAWTLSSATWAVAAGVLLLAGSPTTPATRLITPVVQSLLDELSTRRHVRGAVVASHVQAAAAPSNPNPHQLTIQAAQLAARRARHGGIVQSRWPGYEWAGLAPVNPTPRQVVQDAAAVWQAREDHRRGLIVAPPVQLAATTAGAAPVVPPLPKQVVQDQAAFQPRRQQHGGRVLEPGVQLAAASAPPPPAAPLPRQVVILARATPRTARTGRHIVTSRIVTAPVAPPRPTIVDHCPATRRRGGTHVIIGRPLVAPAQPAVTTPPRPVVISQALNRRRQRRGAVIRQGPQMGVFGTAAAAPPVPPFTGYPPAGDTGHPTTGDTAYPGTGDTGRVAAGLTAQVRI